MSKFNSKYNWCPCCWFGAKLEIIRRKFYDHIICHNCGTIISDYRDGTFSGDPPMFFSSDEEWNEYWKEHFQKKLGDA